MRGIFILSHDAEDDHPLATPQQHLLPNHQHHHHEAWQRMKFKYEYYLYRLCDHTRARRGRPCTPDITEELFSEPSLAHTHTINLLVVVTDQEEIEDDALSIPWHSASSFRR